MYSGSLMSGDMSKMMSSSSSSGGPIPSLMGDMGSMMGGGQMALDMDMESMMAKMKGDMKLGGGKTYSLSVNDRKYTFQYE